MGEYQAVPISKVEGGLVANGGQVLLVKVSIIGGGEMVLAIPSQQLHPLIDMAAFGRTESLKILGAPTGLRETFPTTWWELGKDPNGTVILSLTFGSGGRLDFVLPGLMPENMLETLQSMMGSSTPLPPGTSIS